MAKLAFGSREYQHVLVEGPDGSGKTTLARHLEAAHGYAYSHAGPPAEGDYETDGHGRLTLDQHYRRAVDAAEAPTVFDRLSHSEAVYSPVVRPNQIAMTHRELERFCAAFRGAGGLIVLCLPRWEVCLRRWAARAATGQELLATVGQLRDVWEGYADLRNRLADPFDVVVTEDWDSPRGGFPCQLLCGKEAL